MESAGSFSSYGKARVFFFALSNYFSFLALLFCFFLLFYNYYYVVSLSVVVVIVFGVALCRLTSSCNGGGDVAPSEAPAVVLRLLQEIEQRAAATPSLDLYRLYRTTTPAAEILTQLRLQLGTTELGKYLCLVSLILEIIRHFLRTVKTH